MPITTESVAVKLTDLDEIVTKRHPELLYEDSLQPYEDELDYVRITLKGVVVA